MSEIFFKNSLCLISGVGNLLVRIIPACEKMHTNKLQNKFKCEKVRCLQTSEIDEFSKIFSAKGTVVTFDFLKINTQCWNK